MKMEKNGLVVTPWEARHLAMRLRGVAPIGFVPDDPDAERNPDDPDLLMCAASYLENGGTITVKGREKAPVQGKEPPVDTDHNPPRSLEPQAGNPMEPGRRKVRADHPDVGLTAEGPGDPDEEDDDKEPTAKKRAAPQQPKANDQPLVKRPAKVTDVDDPDEVATRRGSAPKRGN